MPYRRAAPPEEPEPPKDERIASRILRLEVVQPTTVRSLLRVGAPPLLAVVCIAVAAGGSGATPAITLAVLFAVAYACMRLLDNGG